jgi:5-methylcytosine-specific restriction endonuclease McrA
MTREGAKNKIKGFFLANLGIVVTAKQLQEVAAPVSEWARRVRELREQEGWLILSNHDSADLKPGEYLLNELPPIRPDIDFQRGISQKLRAEVLDRNGFTCQMCGKTPGEIDPDTSRKVRLHIGHIVDKSLGGKDELSNLRTLCSTCNQGAKNITHEKPTTIWLLSQIRRAGSDEQRAVYEWLDKKFGE